MKIRPARLPSGPIGQNAMLLPPSTWLRGKSARVQDVGEHERVGVGAVRGQEHERRRAVELAQRVEALGVGVDGPGAAVQRPHDGAPRVDRGRALNGGELAQVAGQLGEHLVRRAPDLAGELVDALAHARGRGHLLGDEPRDLVAIADQRTLGAVHGERRPAAHERREARRAAAAAGLGLVLAAQDERAAQARRP